ncbi:hypothetical protein ACFQ48_02590 [Hymenobacter caeli]|uniref:Tetratricopeptide (TPR) repeat protein n=1 Tax=Hymenobacter caeli TaxID=2735894 RepID=A0ABX2FKQ9_9BACT|nr:hypothetical protein [Hymenobacter caeli]NRT17713.1 tetratricopeptide (TPR) repeat protein [Hymenobacter caeli]
MTKPLLLLLLLTPPAWRELTWVRDRNAAAAAGQAAYARGDADGAARAFATAAATNRAAAGAAALRLNLGHAQRRAGQLAAARATYGLLLDAGVPPPIGSVARQQLAVLAAGAGELAPALGLLRQALVLDPANAGARYDYEVLSAYLAHHRATPQLGPPSAAPGPPPAAKKPVAAGPSPNGRPVPTAGNQAGNAQPGLAPDPNQPAAAPGGPPQSRPDAAGAPDAQRPTARPGAAATGRRAPATAGAAGPVPTGGQPGGSQGLGDAAAPGPADPAGRGGGPGTDTARATDARLQTQRERLKAMSLSPGQAQQLLDALQAQEQQYLQQVPRRPGPAARRGQPTW